MSKKKKQLGKCTTTTQAHRKTLLQLFFSVNCSKVRNCYTDYTSSHFSPTWNFIDNDNNIDTPPPTTPYRDNIRAAPFHFVLRVVRKKLKYLFRNTLLRRPLL